MSMNCLTRTLLTGVILCLLSPAYGQTAGRQEAMSILNSLPADLYAKVQALALKLDASLKTGKLTEADIRQGMMSGHLGEKLATIDPEAGHLLNEISDAMKTGHGPGEENLMPLLGGLGISTP